MKLTCWRCGKKVSTEVPDNTVVRAIVECPDCLSRIDLVGYSVSQYDRQSIWIEKDDGEGMQLTIDDKWWKDNF